MFNWLRSLKKPRAMGKQPCSFEAQVPQREQDAKVEAKRHLDNWEESVNALCFAGLIDTGAAAMEIEWIHRLRRTLRLQADIPAAGEDPVRKERWRPGIEHSQPYPLKVNPDGTLYYRGSVYRIVGDRNRHRPPRKQHR